MLNSLLLRTIQAFPRGRTVEELQALLGTSFRHDERMALLGELETLLADKLVQRRSDGRWVPLTTPAQPLSVAPLRGSIRAETAGQSGFDVAAAPFTRSEAAVGQAFGSEAPLSDGIKPAALLRYYRSALRSDPRGAISETEDRHGAVWQLVAGPGPIVPAEGNSLTLTVPLDGLGADFRQALMRREANEKALAVGWPIAIGRKAGVPAVWPVGLLAAEWKHDGDHLKVEIAADDVLVNPDWLRGAARMTGWRAKDLEQVFVADDGVGLELADFVARLREAAAGMTRGRLTGTVLNATLDLRSAGVFDAAALFLPDESTFTAGAVRDLDAIAAWPEDRLRRTALAPVIGLSDDLAVPDTVIFPINTDDQLNEEQIDAVRAACSAPLTVVTGPPGTGKSQSIVAMAASVLAAGGSVLVASKNHQALDAVEERLGGLATDAPFQVRTLAPGQEVDQSFASVLSDLAKGEEKARRPADPGLQARLADQSAARNHSIDLKRERDALECDLADTLERIESWRAHGAAASSSAPATVTRTPPKWWRRVLRALAGLFRRPSTLAPEASMAHGLLALEKTLEQLRARRSTLADPEDIVQLTARIGDLTRTVLPSILAARTAVPPADREVLDALRADFEFAGARPPLPYDAAAAVIRHRPLWLCSILGTPKRVPLEDGLFDLVIFDEASQCDIASALPLMARARRAVVVGDSKQLNFIAQLGQAQDRNLMQAQGLPVAKMAGYAQSRQSLFDFAQRLPGARRVLLRQQYRSAGPIVDFINENFYGGALRTAHDPTRLRFPAGQKPGLAWTHVPAPAIAGQNNTNRAEVEAIVAHLRKLLVEEGYSGSVGVTSPFRGQVHAIEEAVQAAIPAHKLEAAEFKVATVDGFQGQERDLILFSPTLGASSAFSAVAFVQKDARRLNVAISRARAVAHVFGDLTYARVGSVKQLTRLAAAATEPRTRSGEGVFDSDWERRLYHAMKDRGLKPEPQYDIAGRRLDFALFGPAGPGGAPGVKLDVEVDGRLWHQNIDGRRKVGDLWRDHQLNSLGWRVRRFWVDELARDMEACLDHIERDLTAAPASAGSA